jgi:cytochrome c oxidase subunit II
MMMRVIAFFIGFLPLLGIAAAPVDGGFNLQPAASPIAEQIHSFHNMLLYIIGGIVAVVMAFMLYIIVRFRASANKIPSKTTHNTLLEFIWIIIPVIILVIIVIPSMRLLYADDKVPDSAITVKVTGHQWYWSYEYPDHGGVAFDSYMLEEKDLPVGGKRLLEVDNRLVLPAGVPVRFLITADDVIHSFAMPSLGVKKDAMPGRLNETWTQINKEGVYYGQCSEICGIKHAFMPIAIEAVSQEKFAAWVKSKNGTMPGVVGTPPAVPAAVTPPVSTPPATETPTTETKEKQQ